MDTTVPDSMYEVVATMLKEAVPVIKGKKSFGPDTTLKELGMDSLETLSLVMDLEEHLGVHIPDEDVSTFERVDDISVYLERVLSHIEVPSEEPLPTVAV